MAQQGASPKGKGLNISRSCRSLKLFKLNDQIHEYNVEAIAIAQNMPEPNHLQLLGNKMTNERVDVILNGCPRLDSRWGTTR